MTAWRWPDRSRLEEVEQRPRWLLPGSFNPLHAGHQGMADWVEHVVGESVEFELSVVNVDKPELAEEELARRLGQFAAGQRVWVTRAASFLEKGRLFPGITFVVGADTIRRVAAANYYAADEVARRAAIAELAELGCRFLVFGREDAGQFWTLDRLPLPPDLQSLCQGVQEGEFRRDLSSTQLRSRERPGPPAE